MQYNTTSNPHKLTIMCTKNVCNTKEVRLMMLKIGLFSSSLIRTQKISRIPKLSVFPNSMFNHFGCLNSALHYFVEAIVRGEA